MAPQFGFRLVGIHQKYVRSLASWDFESRETVFAGVRFSVFYAKLCKRVL